MPTGAEAAEIAAVAVAAGAVGTTARWWWGRARGRRRHSAVDAVAAAPGVEPPWAVVVANPTKVARIDDEIAWLEERSVELGWAKPVWLETTPDDVGVGQARVALRAGAHAVLAYGGDGTVRAVATALAGTDVPLGLLPAGTGNLLARNLPVPHADLDAALAVALTGVDTAHRRRAAPRSTSPARTRRRAARPFSSWRASASTPR